MQKVLVSWKTPEYLPKERSADWFWAVGIIAAAIIITAILLNNVLLAIFFLIAALTIFIHAKRQPEVVAIDIANDGVRVGRDMHPYSFLKAFWINENDVVPMLLLKSSGIINPLIIIPINQVDPEKIRATLRTFLIEEEIEEPLSQKLLEYLGF
jgi:hypothetical protein